MVQDTVIWFESKNKAGVKKRGYHVAKPLDISNKAQEIMEIEILCQTHFTGVCVAELATFHSFEDVTNFIVQFKPSPTPLTIFILSKKVFDHFRNLGVPWNLVSATRAHDPIKKIDLREFLSDFNAIVL